jgi:hypothetical protein
MESNRGLMVFDLLDERIYQASKATHQHPHGEVLTLHIRCADVLRVSVTRENGCLRSDALPGAVFTVEWNPVRRFL